jgi:hypothetical protein
MAAMRAREEFQPINTRASLIVNNFGGRRRPPGGGQRPRLV